MPRHLSFKNQFESLPDMVTVCVKGITEPWYVNQET